MCMVLVDLGGDINGVGDNGVDLRIILMVPGVPIVGEFLGGIN
jgi:hypothetical protein